MSDSDGVTSSSKALAMQAKPAVSVSVRKGES
jgi:hypothetical protein